ncbi:hypothetical protein GCM10029992_66400 [Glycomyces albus]
MSAQEPYRPQMQPPPPQGWQQPAYGQHPYPPQQMPPGYQYAVQWPMIAAPAPAMVDGFMLLQPRLKPIPSGPAIGSLVAGIGGTIAAVPGLISAAINPWAGLTFFMLSALLGVGSIMLGTYARRQIRAAGGASRGAAWPCPA